MTNQCRERNMKIGEFSQFQTRINAWVDLPVAGTVHSLTRAWPHYRTCTHEVGSKDFGCLTLNSEFRGTGSKPRLTVHGKWGHQSATGFFPAGAGRVRRLSRN